MDVIRLASVVAVVGLLAGPAVAEPTEEEAPPPPPCAAPEFRQLDFWVGTWEGVWEGGSGTNVIDRPYGDCVVRERFDGGDFQGMSVSTWDPKARLWRQTWVDNRGAYLDFTGGMDGDRMILSRAVETNEGEVRQRMVFRDITESSFTWDWETSRDGGETWELRWQIEYRRKR
jgi:hypothetical protein